MAEHSRFRRRIMVVVLCCEAMATAVIVFLLNRSSSPAPPSRPVESKSAEGLEETQQRILSVLQANRKDAEQWAAKAAEDRPLGAKDVPEAIERGMMMDAKIRQAPMIDLRETEITTTVDFSPVPGMLKRLNHR